MTATPATARFFTACTAALLVTLPLFASPAVAAERVRMPVPWHSGMTLAYDTESIHREKNAEGAGSRRVTDRTEVRVTESGRNGHTLVWTTHDSRVEAIDGDRGTTDLIAPMLEQLDELEVVIELDRDGRYRKVRNLDAVAVRVRAAMRPILEANLEKTLGKGSEKVSKYDRDAALAIAREQLGAMLDRIITLDGVETVSSNQAKTFTAFVGKSLQAGKAYRDAEPIESPLEGTPLPGKREYTLEIDREDANLARIRWTHALDTAGDAAAQWALVAELTGDAPTGDGAPKDLSLREEGVLLFRRDTGIIELVETVNTSRYGRSHNEHERHRMRLRGSARTWAQEEAARRP
jgi:hypothetical protein